MFAGEAAAIVGRSSMRSIQEVRMPGRRFDIRGARPAFTAGAGVGRRRDGGTADGQDAQAMRQSPISDTLN